MFEKKALKEIQPQLQELEKEMIKISDKTNKVEAIIRLFQIISPLQDAGGFSKLVGKLSGKKKYSSQLEAAVILQKHIENAGRNLYGMNRTHEGEEVTASNVFLGNVFGLWTKTADYWLRNKSKLEQTFRPDVSKNPERPVSEWYLINDYRCGDFVKNHTNGILKQIAILKIA